MCTCLCKEPVLWLIHTIFHPFNWYKPCITVQNKWELQYFQQQLICLNWNVFQSSLNIIKELSESDIYLNGDGRSTTEFGSNKKCFWVTLPVWVSMVMTGKPIWRVQRFMISWTECGICKPGVLSTTWPNKNKQRIALISHILCARWNEAQHISKFQFCNLTDLLEMVPEVFIHCVVKGKCVEIRL